MTEEICPICERPTKSQRKALKFSLRIVCDRCGTFYINREAVDDLPAETRKWDDIWRSKVSFFVRRMQAGDEPPKISLDFIRQIYVESELPTPAEQGDNLILVLGDELRNRPGDKRSWTSDQQHELAARIGARNQDDIHYIVAELVSHGLLEDTSTKGLLSLRPTFEGWRHHQELKRQAVESNVAFMAMPFGDKRLDRVYNECFRPAVVATGFRLFRIDENALAGSIINRMRVEIRRSRFVVVELTDNNPGAYWEAGFAEGLDRPVFYTCEKGREPHFDTRQLLTVFWKEDDFDAATQELKDTIRATLPVEAKMED